MSDLSDAILSSTDRDSRDQAIYAVLGIDAPGAYAIREPDGRLMVWASERASENDDGKRATYRSTGPITDEVWSIVTMLAWIDDYQEI